MSGWLLQGKVKFVDFHTIAVAEVVYQGLLGGIEVFEEALLAAGGVALPAEELDDVFSGFDQVRAASFD